MKTKIALILRLFILLSAYFVFQFNSILNYYNWYRCILKAKIIAKLYKKQCFVIPKSKTSLMVVSGYFVNVYNDTRKKMKLNNKEKFDQFKMKKISIITLQDKAYYKTKYYQ